jgi:hypothetical protein
MYKLLSTTIIGPTRAVMFVNNNTTIPYDPANTDYQQFKKDVLAGATLERPDGTVMTQAEADAYIATLP